MLSAVILAISKINSIDSRRLDAALDALRGQGGYTWDLKARAYMSSSQTRISFPGLLDSYGDLVTLDPTQALVLMVEGKVAYMPADTPICIDWAEGGEVARGFVCSDHTINWPEPARQYAWQSALTRARTAEALYKEAEHAAKKAFIERDRELSTAVQRGETKYRVAKELGYTPHAITVMIDRARTQ